MQSTTGITKLNNTDFKFAIYFEDHRCPYCGSFMKLESLSIKGNQDRIRFVCTNCKLIVPIRHLDEDPNKIIPVYDESIFNFFNNFGFDIREKREMLKFRGLNTL